MVATTFGSKALLEKEYNGIFVTPSLNASIEKYSYVKKGKSTMKSGWSDERFEVGNDSKRTFGYNFGAGIEVRRNNLKVSTGYNFYSAKKYTSHQGSLKLEVLF